MTTAGTESPPPDLEATARQLLAEHGPRGAADRLNISTTALLRLAAGSNVRRGTLALAAQALKTAQQPTTDGGTDR